MPAPRVRVVLDENGRKIFVIVKPFLVMGKPLPEGKIARHSVRGIVRGIYQAPPSSATAEPARLFELEITDPLEADTLKAGRLIYLHTAKRPGASLPRVPAVGAEVEAHFDEDKIGAFELVSPNAFSSWKGR